MKQGWMYILRCNDGSYYTGSTNNLSLRLEQHQNGEGANYTKKRRPVALVYFELFDRVDKAFYREKQVQGWSRKKKEALINSKYKELHELAACKNDSHYSNFKSRGFGSAGFGSAGFGSAGFGSAQPPETPETPEPPETENRSLSEAETKGSNKLKR